MLVSLAVLWGIFRIVRRKENDPAIYSYMSIEAFALNHRGGWLRFFVLRLVPVMVSVLLELAVLMKIGFSLAERAVSTSVTVVLYLCLAYFIPFFKAKTFRVKLLHIFVAFSCLCISSILILTSSIIDFSVISPSSVESFIDGLWSTLICAIVAVLFFETLRFDPEEKGKEYLAKTGMEVKVINKQFELMQNSFGTVISKNAELYKTSVGLLYAILIYEDLNRPKQVRKLENWIVRLFHVRLTVGIAQVLSDVPLTDEQSIEVASEILKGSEGMQWKQLCELLWSYNPSQKYQDEVLNIYSFTCAYTGKKPWEPSGM